MNINKRIAYLLFLVATIIWGLAFVAQKNATVIPAFAVCALRSLFAVLFLVGIIPLFDRLSKNGRHLFTKKRIFDFTRREIIGGVVLGILLTAASALQQIGLGDTDSGKAAFITALYVVIVPIISSLLGKKPSIFAIISVPIALVGFYLLCIKNDFTLETSDLLVLGCAIIFSGHIISVDRFSPGCDGLRLSLLQFAVSFILNTIVSLIIEEPVTTDAFVSVLPSLLFLGICSSGIAYTLQILGQQSADPTVSSMILSMESVFGAIGGAILLGETMQMREYIGCSVVLCAVLMAQLEPSSIKRLFKQKEDKHE